MDVYVSVVSFKWMCMLVLCHLMDVYVSVVYLMDVYVSVVSFNGCVC